MRIGIDLDNTIINYDTAFHAAAVGQGLLDASVAPTKRAVKRALADEPAWQKLQGYVYGRGIGAATFYDGVEDFLKTCAAKGIQPVIVSHKTEFGHFDATRTDLREAARAWLTERGALGGAWGVAPESLYFEPTRAAKVKCIAELKLDAFIDDLHEVFDEPEFPATTRQLLFAPEGHTRPHFRDWAAIAAALKLA